MFYTSKEHQITTEAFSTWVIANCFTLQKSIKSQQSRSTNVAMGNCFTLQKSIKSQPTRARPWRARNCFTLQKSIKSQHQRLFPDQRRIVLHFKRASNHNHAAEVQRPHRIVLHFKRASNHNITTHFRSFPLLFYTSKEHQITTVAIFAVKGLDCFTLQKSIKSQRRSSSRSSGSIVLHFKRASNHNPGRPPARRWWIVLHFKRASNHNCAGISFCLG